MSSILVIGESGSGKSTALRNLDPASTFIINALNKSLPFKGGNKKFKQNIVAIDNAIKIAAKIEEINLKRKEIKVIVIDDFQATMTNEYMRGAFEKGYDKFTRIGKGIWDIVNAANNTRYDLKVILLAHSDIDDNGKIRCKTVGKLVNEKISLEGMCTIVLHSKVLDGNYIFITQNDGVSIAKSPMGMFDSNIIPNDFQQIINKIDQYYDGEDVPEPLNDTIKQEYLDKINIISSIDELNSLYKEVKKLFCGHDDFIELIVEKCSNRKDVLQNDTQGDQRGLGQEPQSYGEKHG